VAYLVLAVSGLTGEDPRASSGSYVAMESIAWRVIVPASLAALLTGLVQAVGSAWGLVRHYWVMVKLVLTVVGTAILLGHMPAVSRMAELAGAGAETIAEAGKLPVQLVVHAADALLLLLTTTALSVYKPWGRRG